MKTCFKCRLSKPIDRFYRHYAMADGHLNKCIECAKKDVRERAHRESEKVRAYDRMREKRPGRIKQKAEYLRNHRAKYPERNRARARLDYATRTGKMQRLPCEVCGDPKSHGHHADYSKPLDVRWLCERHHKEVHRNAN